MNKIKPQHHTLIQLIQFLTGKGNIDNISRTKAYLNYYKRNPEIEWAFLASMVSRNAGYNMTDLEGSWFPFCIEKEKREQIFYTYERANWLIFSDAYPQLLIYEASKRSGKPLFHCLSAFSVSIFMQKEWERFFQEGDRKRLMTALIINEQNLIQKPVIEHPFYKKKVFRSFCFRFQDWLHFCSVIFPTLSGEVYGLSVNHFSHLNDRITLGKRLAHLLFHPEHYSKFYEFALSIEHTGSRYDYERNMKNFSEKETPPLRVMFPRIYHHQAARSQWYASKKQLDKWFKTVPMQDNICITEWYKRKQEQLHLAVAIENYVLKKPSY
ncbi:DUF2515 domain-containing protein [Bacillus tianshenii]|nr:DUF2515 domain-containing protein [Bacillus tianshenii]